MTNNLANLQSHSDPVSESAPYRQSIKLRDAVLCVNGGCDTIYSMRPKPNALSSASSKCPDCGSRHRIALTRIVEPMG